MENRGEYYVEKERNFKRSFGEEKARVKLYKSGKQWVKAGIKEIQLLKMLGLPFLNKDVEEISNLETNHNERLKKTSYESNWLSRRCLYLYDA